MKHTELKPGVGRSRVWRVSAWIFSFVLLLVVATSIPFHTLKADEAVLKLEQNHPNPFNSSTVIRFTTPTPGNVELRVFNMLGKEVAIILDKDMEAGPFSILFDGSNLPSGQYSYTLLFTANGSQQKLTKKMYLVK